MGRDFLCSQDLNKLIQGGSYIQKSCGGQHFQTGSQKALSHLGRLRNQCFSLRRKIYINNPPVLTCARPYDKALLFQTIQYSNTTVAG